MSFLTTLQGRGPQPLVQGPVPVHSFRVRGPLVENDLT